MNVFPNEVYGGRFRTNDIQLLYEGISKNHFALTKKKDGLYIANLSRNPIFIDRVRLDKTFPENKQIKLNDRDCIDLGVLTLQYLSPPSLYGLMEEVIR